jgi:hypothetical protein
VCGSSGRPAALNTGLTSALRDVSVSSRVERVYVAFDKMPVASAKWRSSMARSMLTVYHKDFDMATFELPHRSGPS